MLAFWRCEVYILARLKVQSVFNWYNLYRFISYRVFIVCLVIVKPRWSHDSVCSHLHVDIQSGYQKAPMISRMFVPNSQHIEVWVSWYAHWNHTKHPVLSSMYFRADSRFAPRQWETASLCNDVCHWLGISLESTLYLMFHNSHTRMMVSLLYEKVEFKEKNRTSRLAAAIRHCYICKQNTCRQTSDISHTRL